MRLLALLLLCLAALGRGDGRVAPVVEKEEGEQGEAVLAPAPEPSVHTVFSAECTPYFDWQSLALVRSHKLVRVLSVRSADTPLTPPRPSARSGGGHAGTNHQTAGVRRGAAEEVRPQRVERAALAMLTAVPSLLLRPQLQVPGHSSHSRAPQLCAPALRGPG